MESSWKVWALAARPKTLTAAFVPILVGTSLAFMHFGSVSWAISFYALITAVFIQIGTNLVNDALDFKKGADTKERLGPLRVTQSGLLTMEYVLAWAVVCFGAALVFSIPLIIKGGWPLAVIMALSVLCGYLYTGGAKPLAYIGLGDLFVLIFFGYVATDAVFCLQGGKIGIGALVAGTQVGLLSTVLIAVNNLRDIVGDRRSKKCTLAVRFGARFSKLEISFLIVFPYLLNVFWLFLGSQAAAFLPLAALPFGVLVIKGVWEEEPGSVYNRFLGFAALQHLLFGILLSLGLFLT